MYLLKYFLNVAMKVKLLTVLVVVTPLLYGRETARIFLEDQKAWTRSGVKGGFMHPTAAIL